MRFFDAVLLKKSTVQPVDFKLAQQLLYTLHIISKMLVWEPDTGQDYIPAFGTLATPVLSLPAKVFLIRRPALRIWMKLNLLQQIGKEGIGYSPFTTVDNPFILPTGGPSRQRYLERPP